MTEAPVTCMDAIHFAEVGGMRGNDGNAILSTACKRGGQVPVRPRSAAITAPWQGAAPAPPGCGRATTFSRYASDVWPHVCRITRSEGIAVDAAVGVPPAESPCNAISEAVEVAPTAADVVDEGVARREAYIARAGARARATYPKYDLVVGDEQENAAWRERADEDHEATDVVPWHAKLDVVPPDRLVGQLELAAGAPRTAAARWGNGWQVPNAHGEAPRSRCPRGVSPARAFPAYVPDPRGVSPIHVTRPVQPTGNLTPA